MDAPYQQDWTLEQRALDTLTRPFLTRIAAQLDIPLHRSSRVADLRSLLANHPFVTFGEIIEATTKPGLRRLCDEFELPRSGTVATLKERLRLIGDEWEGAVWRELEDSPPPETHRPPSRRKREQLQQPPPETRRYQSAALKLVKKRLDPKQPILLQIASGGGKTWIANDVVSWWCREHEGAPILWVAKDWWLLRQAAQELQRRAPAGSLTLGRIGGRRGLLRGLPDQSSQTQVVYTTLKALSTQLTARTQRRRRVGLLIWDECHWGENAASGQQMLAWCRRRRIPVLGLSSTPRPPEQSHFKVVYRKSFPELVAAGYLARPVPLEPVETGVSWTPQRAGGGDFHEKSLHELAANAERNRIIIEHYARQRQRYGQTVLYACSIDHADRLARLFERREGIAARPIHSGQPDSMNALYVDQFNRGEIEVLINVGLASPAFEVPEVRTVFLCRPTVSDVLFNSMISRAARRTQNKFEFNLVEFTDNLERHGELLHTARSAFHGAIKCRSVRGKGRRDKEKRSPRKRHADIVSHHQFDPRGAAALIPDEPGVPEAIRGLWYRTGQTFGLELELTATDFSPQLPPGKDWHDKAEALLAALTDALGPERVAKKPYPEYHHEDRCDNNWNVEWDRSCGWEVTSRVLRDRDGFEEVIAACGAIEAAARGVGLRLNYQTGTHVHIGWLGHTIREVRCALELARLFEPALATLVAPSRLTHFDGEWYNLDRPNEFCKPLATVFSSRALKRVTTLEKLWTLSERKAAKDLTLNIRPLDDLHTVEVRLHNGTLDPEKILPWVSLWQQILWCAGSPRIIPSVPDRAVLRPEGDIVALARQLLPVGGQRRFLERLDRRRHAILRLWRRQPELSQWVELSRSWQPPQS